MRYEGKREKGMKKKEEERNIRSTFTLEEMGGEILKREVCSVCHTRPFSRYQRSLRATSSSGYCYFHTAQNHPIFPQHQPEKGSMRRAEEIV